MLRAYNDWHIDDWCGEAPRPLHPARDPADLGPRGDGPRGPARREEGLPRDHLRRQPGRPRLPEPARRALGSVLEGVRATRARSSASTSARARGMNLQDPNAPVEIMIAGTPITLFDCATELVFSDIFTEVPERSRSRSPRAGSAGSRTSSSASTTSTSTTTTGRCTASRRQEAERRVPRAHHHLLHRRRGRRAQPRPDRHRQHHLGVRLPALRHDLAARAREAVGARSTGVPDDEIHKITWQNATRHFQYDPFKHIPKEQCTVGALRAQAKDVDLTPRVGARRQAALRLRAAATPRSATS